MSSLPPVPAFPLHQVFGETYKLSREGLPKGLASGLNTPTNTPITSGKTTPSAANSQGSGSITPDLKHRLMQKDQHASLDSSSSSPSQPLNTLSTSCLLQPDRLEQARFIDSVQRRLGKLLSESEVTQEEDAEGRDRKGVKVRLELEGDGVSQLQDLNEDYYQVLVGYARDRRALEEKYLHKCARIFRRRRDLCNKIRMERGVNVWLTALQRDTVMAEAVAPHDVALLTTLVDIRTKDLTERHTCGFVLEFEFEENTFFANKVLTKTYIVPNMYEHGDPVVESAVGCEIQWKDASNEPRSDAKGQPRRSFFDFFHVPFMKDFTKKCQGLDREEYTVLQSKVNDDFRMGIELRQHVIPHMYELFVGDELTVISIMAS